jgi:hypothetical protein
MSSVGVALPRGYVWVAVNVNVSELCTFPMS